MRADDAEAMGVPIYIYVAQETPKFGARDWAVLAAYLAVVVTIGVLAGKKNKRSDADEQFLAGRSMPVWAVAISLLATSQSAATFVGGPQQAYAGNLTYLAANIGALLAAVVVAVLFIPAFYRAQVTTVYELLGNELGGAAQRTASAMFLIGRVFASGARLFIVALPFSLIAFGEVDSGSMTISIVVIATAAALYTMIGGIRAVIWTDVLQAVVYIGAVVVVLFVILNQLGMSLFDALDVLRYSGAREKLTFIDSGMQSADDFARPYTLWAIVFGMTLFNMAALGTDQDLTQRLLTCRSARRGSWSVILSMLMGWPVVLLFLTVGLLLYVYYNQQTLIGVVGPPTPTDDSRTVFLHFILSELPTGLRGLMLAGLFAAAMSSMDSALNAMAASTVTDFRREKSSVLRSKFVVGAWAAVLAAFAVFCIFWQKQSGMKLIDFALSVMVFAYSGLLGVFLCVLLTKRGSAVSAIGAMATGFLAVTYMQPTVWDKWAWRVGIDFTLAFPWKMVVATTLSFLVCVSAQRGKSIESSA